MLDVKMQIVLLLNLQILFFYHKLRFGENKAIIDLGRSDHDSNVIQFRGGENDKEAKLTGSKITNTHFDSTSDNSLQLLLE